MFGGVYAVWKRNGDLDELLYVGSASKGMQGRLRSHALGQWGSDQFCLYVFDNFILPELDIKKVLLKPTQEITRSLNGKVKSFIREHLSYTVFCVSNNDELIDQEKREARDLEEAIRRGGVEGCRTPRPRLNPIGNE